MITIKTKRFILVVLIVSVSLMLGFNMKAYGATKSLQYHSTHTNPINASASPAISDNHYTKQLTSIPVYTSKEAFIAGIHGILSERRTNATMHINTYEFDWEQVGDIFKEALDTADDYDHYNYHSASFNMRGYSKNDFELTMNINYLTTKSQEEEISIKVEQLLTSMFEDGMSDDRKEKLIHDWVVRNVSYDQNLVEHSAYAGFFKGTTVCQGYSLMIYKMLKEAGIETRIITSETHGWNLVKLRNNYYHLDATWNDPVPDRGPNYVSYDYYNLSDAELNEKDTSDSHLRDMTKYPKAAAHYNLDSLNLLIDDVNSLDWSDLSNEPYNSITNSLTLPGTGRNGSIIHWKSTNPAIADTGVVTQPAFNQGDTSGSLIATITNGNISEEKYFPTTVLKDNTQPTDTTPPIVISTEPADGTIDVAVVNAVTVTFSENIREDNNFPYITLKTGDRVITATPIANTNSLIIYPTDLDYNTTYTINIPAGAVQDQAGNSLMAAYKFSFNTQKKQNHDTPLQWESKTTTNIHKSWTISFNIPVDSTTINRQSILVTDNDDRPVAVEVTVGNDNKSAVVNPPTEGYILGQEYLLKINKNLKSLSGRYLKNSVIMPFIVQK